MVFEALWWAQLWDSVYLEYRTNELLSACDAFNDEVYVVEPPTFSGVCRVYDTADSFHLRFKPVHREEAIQSSQRICTLHRHPATQDIEKSYELAQEV